MADKIRETIRQNWGTIPPQESDTVVVYKGVCSDHKSKAPRDCCRETVREAAKEYSEKNG